MVYIWKRQPATGDVKGNFSSESRNAYRESEHLRVGCSKYANSAVHRGLGGPGSDIIDFTTKTAVLQKIDPRIVIKLEQSEGKHLLLNMSKDLLENGILRSRFGSPWSSICQGNPNEG